MRCSSAATRSACSTTSARRSTGAARSRPTTSNPRAEFVKGDVREPAEPARRARRHRGRLPPGRGRRRRPVDVRDRRYVDVNTFGGAVAARRAGRTSRAPSRKLIVASSMSIYGEGAYQCAAHGRGLSLACVRRSSSRRATGRCAAPRAASRSSRVPTDEDEAALPDLDLRHHQARPRGDVPGRRPRLRHPDRGPALLQRLRPAPGALEPLHRRRGDLRRRACSTAARRSIFEDGAADARLRPRQRHRPGERRWPWSRAPATTRCSTSAPAPDVSVLDVAELLAERPRRRHRARDRAAVPRRRHPPLLRRHRQDPAPAGLRAQRSFEDGLDELVAWARDAAARRRRRARARAS